MTPPSRFSISLQLPAPPRAVSPIDQPSRLPRALDSCAGAPCRCPKSCSMNSYKRSIPCRSAGRAACTAVPLPKEALLIPLWILPLLTSYPVFQLHLLQKPLAKANQDGHTAVTAAEVRSRVHLKTRAGDCLDSTTSRLRWQPPLNHTPVPALQCTLGSDAVTAGDRAQHLILRSLFLPYQCHQGASAFPPQHVGLGWPGTTTLQSWRKPLSSLSLPASEQRRVVRTLQKSLGSSWLLALSPTLSVAILLPFADSPAFSPNA